MKSIIDPRLRVGLAGYLPSLRVINYWDGWYNASSGAPRATIGVGDKKSVKCEKG